MIALLQLTAAMAALLGSGAALYVNSSLPRVFVDETFLRQHFELIQMFGRIEDVDSKGIEGHEEFTFTEDQFTKPEIVEEFKAFFKKGFTARKGVYSFSSSKSFYNTDKFMELLYYAKDFETFIDVAKWARKHMHPLQFFLGFTASAYEREDTRLMHVSPIYEIFPHYFVDSQIMFGVNECKMKGILTGTFPYNSTGYAISSHPVHSLDMSGRSLDHKVSYFREDPGWNNYIAKFIMHFPQIENNFGSKEKSSFRRGETFYYFVQQIFARYSLERTAVSLPAVEHLTFTEAITDGYHPHINDFHGRPFVPRPDRFVPAQSDPSGFNNLNAFYKRIEDDVAKGLIMDYDTGETIKLDEKEGTELLGRLLFMADDRVSFNYYGNYFWQILSYLAEMVKFSNNNDMYGGVLGNFITMGRDPVFYSVILELLHIFDAHKSQLPPYTKSDLFFDGVEINDVQFSELRTSLDFYEFLLANGVEFAEDEIIKDFRYTARTQMLGHKPFHFNITVTSDKEQDAMVRVFVGPCFTSDFHSLSLEESRNSLFQIDQFSTKLAEGMNIFERYSEDAYGFSEEKHFDTLWEDIQMKIDAKEGGYYDDGLSCGIPNRLMLPRGSSGGRCYKMYFMFSPYTMYDNSMYKDPCRKSRFYDGRAFGFPFDRYIDKSSFENLPNFFTYTATIYHG